MSEKDLKKAKEERGLLFLILKWTMIVLLAFFVLKLITLPIRKNWSDDYLARGDIYLEQKKYLSSETEYDKALMLYSGNKTAVIEKALAKRAAENVLELQGFYQNRNLQSQIYLFDEATTVPSRGSDGLKTVQVLIGQNEFQLAAVLAKTVTEMNGDYRDGWLYLGISNLKIVENCELNKADRAYYLDKAKTALSRAKTIDSSYQPTLDYLAEAGKL